MGSRATGRKLAMQILYQAEIRKINIDEILSDLIENDSYPEKTKEWARDISKEAWTIKERADKFINQTAVDWSIERISLIDKSILRLAITELIKTETPYKIIINESIELAKDFSESAASSFINGILGRFIEEELCLPE